MLTQRTTQYVTEVREFMAKRGHATNAAILHELQKQHPKLTATTVHRITARLLASKQLQPAPPAPDGSARFDSNLGLHDHFLCKLCHSIRDIMVPPDVFESLEASLEDYKLNGRLTLEGTCRDCNRTPGAI